MDTSNIQPATTEDYIHNFNMGVGFSVWDTTLGIGPHVGNYQQEHVFGPGVGPSNNNPAVELGPHVGTSHHDTSANMAGETATGGASSAVGSDDDAAEGDNAEMDEDEIPDTPVEQMASTSRPPKKTKKATVWKWFSKVTGSNWAQCLLCPTRYSHKTGCGTGTLTRHLTAKHKNRDMDAPDMQRQPDGTMAPWRYDQNYMRICLAQFIVQNELPFSFAQNELFENFLQKAVQCKFKKISRATCFRDGVKQYEKEIIVLRNEFKNFNGRISLTSDLWQGSGSYHFSCITAHWIDKDWIMRKRIIEFAQLDSPHNGDCIRDATMSSLNYWGIKDKIMSISLDNASNNVNAIKSLKPAMNLILGGQLFHVRCICHILHLCVKDGLSVLIQSIDRIRVCLSHINRYPPRVQAFNTVCETHGMPIKHIYLDVPHRWNATYRMLIEAKPYSEPITFFCHRSLGPNSILADDWNICDILVPYLVYFEEFTKIMSSCYTPTSNIMLLYMVSVVRLFHQHRNHATLKNIIKEMEKKWVKYYKKVPNVCILSSCLDPRVRLIGTLELLEKYHSALNNVYNGNEERNRILQLLYSLYDMYAPSTDMDESPTNASRGSGFSIFDELLSNQQSNQPSVGNYTEIHLFVQKPPQKFDKDFDILKWWRQNESLTPVLARIARDLLSSQMSTVASERAFSAGHRVLTDARNRLKPGSVKFCMIWKDMLDQQYREKTLRKVETVLAMDGEEDNEDATMPYDFTNIH
uniref:Transposase n=1 Tax=Antirrhinum majus TaxID=4151 RepID=Q38743_ANTMA